MPFLEKGMHQLAWVIKSGYIQWDTATRDGFFQRIDARVKIIFLLMFILIVSMKQEIMTQVVLEVFVFILALVSRLNIFSFYKRIFLLGFLFGFLIAFPSAFNVITKGEIVVPLLTLSRDYHFWAYQIPGEIGITREGLQVVAMLSLRVINSLSLAFLVLYTTPFPDIIKALKVLKVPDSFLMVLTLCYRYIFLFAKTVEDMHLAKKSRLVRQANNADGRRWIAGRIGFLFKKTRLRCEEIFRAMLGRGFAEEIKFYESRRLNSRDLITGLFLLAMGGLFLWY